jgi:hypothetical protein
LTKDRGFALTVIDIMSIWYRGCDDACHWADTKSLTDDLNLKLPGALNNAISMQLPLQKIT